MYTRSLYIKTEVSMYTVTQFQRHRGNYVNIDTPLLRFQWWSRAYARDSIEKKCLRQERNALKKDVR